MKAMEMINNILRVLSVKIREDTRIQCGKIVAMSVVVCVAAGIMLIMNIIRHSDMMAVTSVILMGGFAVTGIIAGVFHNAKVSSVLMAVILTGVFTVFPISGGNEGFAVLWLLLVPLFSISFFGIEIGMGMNIYFTVLILALFCTPLNHYIQGLYTDNFLHRFPVLFIVDSVLAQFVSLTSEYYYKTTRMQAYTDDMTGAYNRKYFMELLGDKDTPGEDLCISVIDVNGLKETNDDQGHAAGDELICTVPMLVKKAFGEDVVIARMGGDEFALLTHSTREDTEDRLARMKEYADGHKGEMINSVSLSVGTAYAADNGGAHPEELYRTADQLMYQDKAAYYRAHDRRRKQQ